MKLDFIELGNLSIAAANMRGKGKDPEVADLIPSIRARGVLVPLLVRPNCSEGRYEIVAGRRRFTAVSAVAREGGAVPPIPCAILDEGDDADALEASMLENLARVQPDEVSQWEAFVALVKAGRSVEDVADSFGFEPRAVKCILALGNLLPRIRTLYRGGEIDAGTVRHLTLASKSQQNAWLGLFDDNGAYCPTGHQLKAWLFGGTAVAVKHALFDTEEAKAAMASDYRVPEPAKAMQPKRGMFDGLKLTVSREALGEITPKRRREISPAKIGIGARSLDPTTARPLIDKAVERFARAKKDIVDVRRAGGKELPHELDAYRKAARDLDALRPDGARDLRAALGDSYNLTKEAAEGRTASAIAAMDRQSAARAAERVATERAERTRSQLAAETEKRADLFVATWKKENMRVREAPTYTDRDQARANLTDMAKSLHRDPQLESLLHNRRAELGLKPSATGSLSHDLQQWLGRSRGMGISM